MDSFNKHLYRETTEYWIHYIVLAIPRVSDQVCAHGIAMLVLEG